MHPASNLGCRYFSKAISLVANICLIIHSYVKKSNVCITPFWSVLWYIWLHMILALTFCFDYVFHFQNLPASCFSGYSTLLAPANEVLIPPELLSSKTVWTPDRELGTFSPYWPVARHHLNVISDEINLLNFPFN